MSFNMTVSYRTHQRTGRYIGACDDAVHSTVIECHKGTRQYTTGHTYGEFDSLQPTAVYCKAELRSAIQDVRTVQYMM